MSHKLPIVLLITTNIVLLSIVVYLKKAYDKSIQITQTDRRTIVLLENKIETARKLFYYKMIEEDVKFDPNIKLYDTKNNKYTLEQLIKNKKVPIFYSYQAMYVISV